MGYANVNFWDGSQNPSVQSYRTQTHEDGDYTIDTYSFLGIDNSEILTDDGKLLWKEHSKVATTKNYDSDWVYDPSEVRSRECFSFENGVARSTYKIKITWVNPVAIRYEYENYETGEHKVTYNYVAPGQEPSRENIYCDEATGRYGIFENDGTYTYYSYYEADGTESNRFRKIGIDKGDIFDSYGNVWETWKDGEWSKCHGTIDVYDKSSNMFKITFDELSRASYIEEYIGNVLTSKTELTYTDDGYTEKEYTMDASSDTLYIATLRTFNHEDNRPACTELIYDTNDNLTKGTKQINDEENKVFYLFTLYGDEWHYDGGIAEDILETSPDGVVTDIRRHVLGYNEIHCFYKTVYIQTPTYSMQEYYSYYMGDGKWQNASKIEMAIPERRDFTCIEPIDPEAYNDDYFFTDNTAESQTDEWAYADWAWDYKNGSGWICNKSLPEYTYPDEYTQAIKHYEGGNLITDTLKVDSSRRKILYSRTTHSQKGDHGSKHTWAYDEWGRLTEAMRYTGYVEKMDCYDYDRYYYSAIEIGEASISNITTDSAISYTVYNLQGICILCNDTLESVLDLPHGIYIVNGKKTVIK